MWSAIFVSTLTAVIVALVQRSRLAGVVFAAGSVALGVALITFEYRDVARSAGGDAALDGVAVETLGRHDVACARPRWLCERGAPGANGSYRVPFTCGTADVIAAAYYERAPGCADLPSAVRGYLLDENEAGGGAPAWLLQVDAPRRRFPGFLSIVGALFVCLGFASTRIFTWARRRRAASR